MTRPKKSKDPLFTLDEVSDDVFDLVLVWRKEVRRRQALKKLPMQLTQEDWMIDFREYLKSRMVME